ncbi:MAG: cell division protein ZapE [Alphaproteobacteria bacterium]|nr:cell division protein ZapE [Alphaproteobacteria bacterium]
MMTTLLDTYNEKLANAALQPDEDQRRALCALDGFCGSLAARPAPEKRKFRLFGGKRAAASSPGGFYFHGGVGRGKSMVMDMFFAAAPVEEKRRVHFHAFMLEVHDALHVLRSVRAKGAQGRIDGDLITVAEDIAARTRLLCFDEFQVKDVADAMILGRLFTALFDRGVAVVMTSNIAPDDLYADGLQRDRFLPFIALLKERLTVFAFSGETDYRLRRLSGDLKVYFWPHDADAHESLDRIFRTVADEEAGAPRDITVKGRRLHVPRAANEVAAFSFGELCEQPKSALDYLELTKRFRVFIVENVPRLDDRRSDALLRFVTFVDTLYDSRARLAVSAAAPPDQLYEGQENRLVFERTVSRLMEMQSREYREA